MGLKGFRTMNFCRGPHETLYFQVEMETITMKRGSRGGGIIARVNPLKSIQHRPHTLHHSPLCKLFPGVLCLQKNIPCCSFPCHDPSPQTPPFPCVVRPKRCDERDPFVCMNRWNRRKGCCAWLGLRRERVW